MAENFRDRKALLPEMHCNSNKSLVFFFTGAQRPNNRSFVTLHPEIPSVTSGRRQLGNRVSRGTCVAFKKSLKLLHEVVKLAKKMDTGRES
jgi:hypothetical protein